MKTQSLKQEETLENEEKRTKIRLNENKIAKTPRNKYKYICKHEKKLWIKLIIKDFSSHTD